MAMGVGAPALGDGDDVALVNAHIQDGGASAASMFEPVLGKLGLAKDDYEAALQTMSMMFGEEHAWAREARHICCPPPLILQVREKCSRSEKLLCEVRQQHAAVVGEGEV
mmetsp:Transcript_101936/g.292528  ORF Transcript_101936/g.292528 Transcript_101936/m.292528 type:complete len:110 (-) Transcript_101936:60-389(-)